MTLYATVQNSTTGFVKCLTTGKDNVTHDIGRVSFIVTNIAFLLFCGYIVYTKQVWDMQSFGIAYCAICTGFGAMTKLKEGTEPPSTKIGDKL